MKIYALLDGYESVEFDRAIDLNSYRIKCIETFGADVTGDVMQFRDLPNCDVVLVDFGGEAAVRESAGWLMARNLRTAAEQNPATTYVLCSQHTERWYESQMEKDAGVDLPNVVTQGNFFARKIKLTEKMESLIDDIESETLKLLRKQDAILDGLV